MVSTVVKRGIGDETALLSRQVDAQFVAKSHADHVVAPTIHRCIYVRIFAPVAHHVVESPAEIGVTRRADGLD